MEDQMHYHCENCGNEISERQFKYCNQMCPDCIRNKNIADRYKRTIDNLKIRRKKS